MKKLSFLISLLLTLSIFAQTTYVPDDNFEQELIDLGYDDVLDDYVLTANIDGVTYIDISDRNINDLTGIEDFTALTRLYCHNNQLTNIDVSQNTALTRLYCFENQLTTLDVSHNTALTYLWCGANQLTNLDVSQNTVLTLLTCYENQLTNLDVSQNTALTRLSCYENQLTNLNISQNTALTSLRCSSNQLTNLDVSQNTALTLLTCNNNQLTNLDVRNGNNTNIINVYFVALNNPNLTCIFVDDSTWSTANWEYIDPNSTFIETQAECDALSIQEAFDDYSLQIFPNPTSSNLNIITDRNIKSVIIYTVLGKKVLETNKKNIDLSALQSGVYTVQVSTNNLSISKKFIKL